MPAISVHIGVPKTATSYIQAWLHQNRRRLRERGVFVPDRPILAHRLAVEHLSGTTWDQRPDIIEIRNTPLEDARESFAKADASNATARSVISSEYFYYADPEKVAGALRQQFSAEIDVVVYIRSQCDLVLSGHNQDVKRLGKTASRPKPGYHKLYDWGVLLDGWAKQFGKEHLKVISFDVSSRDRTILNDFVTAACPSVSTEFADGVFEAPEVQNESLPADILEFKRLANTLGPSGIYDYQWLEEVLRAGYVGPRFGVSADEVGAWRSLYVQSNEYVAREYFNGAASDQIFPADAQRANGVDMQGQLPLETVAKLLAFAVRRQENQRREINQRLRAIEVQMTNLWTSRPKPDPKK
jgi:hypothetical protein